MTETGPHATEHTPHPRLTVALVPADVPADLQARLRASGTVVLDESALRSRAEDVAESHRSERQAAVAALEAAVAKADHEANQWADRLAKLTAARTEASEGAAWATRAHTELPARRRAIEAARAALEAAETEQRQARAALERVLEQSAAAGAAMDEASRELEDLAVAGMDETGLRRELEASGQAVRHAEDAYSTAARHLAALQAERDTAVERKAAFEAALAAHGAADVVDQVAVERVRTSLDRYRTAATAAEPDAFAQDLADAWTDLQADLAELQSRSAPVPDAAQVAAAEERVKAATAAVESARGGQDASVMDDATRAELDAAHATIQDLEERSGRRLGSGGARRQLDEARAKEQAILDRFGFASYIDVVLTGGRQTGTDQGFVVAQRELREALDARAALRQDLRQVSPELTYLEGERQRLLAEVVKVLGGDPGGELVARLRAHRPVAPTVVAALADALMAARVDLAGAPADVAAERWLAEQDAIVDDHARWSDAAQQVRAEFDALTWRLEELDREIPDAQEAAARAGEELELATRSVGAFEAELSVRAAEDARRLKRMAAAEQLRAQVEAMSATLTTAERTTREALDVATVSVAEAERALLQAQGEVSSIEDRARHLARLLPTDKTPSGEPLSTLPALAHGLEQQQSAFDAQVAEAEAAHAVAASALASAAGEADAARQGLQRANDDDFVEALIGALENAERRVLAIDRAFDGADDALRQRLLATLVTAEVRRPAVLLTADPSVAGWAIELPESAGTVTTLDTVLNSAAFAADNSQTNHDATPGPARAAGRR